MMKDVKHIFNCAIANGEAKIIDRILVRVLPELLKYNQKITSESIIQAQTIDVPDELYNYIRAVAQELTGLTCCDA
jgi:hypothetical protein